jgi:hypothetical protein
LGRNLEKNLVFLKIKLRVSLPSWPEPSPMRV